MNPKNSEARGFRSHKRANGQFQEAKPDETSQAIALAQGF